jgi:hypothetical protein
MPSQQRSDEGKRGWGSSERRGYYAAAGVVAETSALATASLSIGELGDEQGALYVSHVCHGKRRGARGEAVGGNEGLYARLPRLEKRRRWEAGREATTRAPASQVLGSGTAVITRSELCGL